MSRTLPIQLVETRGPQDIFHKEGMGDNNLPSWATEDTVFDNAARIRASFEEVGRLFDERGNTPDHQLPIVLSATLNEKGIAKSFRGNVRSLFDTNRKKNLIGGGRRGSLLVKVDTKNDLVKMASSISEDRMRSISMQKKIGLVTVDDLSVYKPLIEDNLEGQSVKIRLIDYLNAEYNTLSEKMLMKRCEELGIEIKFASFSSESRLYYADNVSGDAIEGLATMDAILSVKKMPYLEISASPDEFNTKIDVKAPSGNGQAYPQVGVLDSGVEPIDHLAPWMAMDENVANFADFEINRRHGTAVASIINYGDELLGESVTKCGPSIIASFIVNSDKGISEIEMVEHIKTAIESHPEIKIWNLSQGSDMEIDDDVFSDFAIEIDKLQKMHKVLICKSAGNIDRKYPDKVRICAGADSVMSLVVGSVANVCLGDGDAQPYQRSPFSRIGPGPSYITKPDLSHIGGNYRKGVHTFTETGFESEALAGTSFSTPRISSLAANLANVLDGDFDPLLIKALLVHNSSYPIIDGKEHDALLKEMGHGIPSDITSILHNDSDEFSMIFRPSLENNDYQIQDIPFPASMIDENGNFYGDITVTVASEPILKPTEGSEYCQSNINALLQTYDGINYFVLNAAGTPKYYRNAERLINPHNVLTKSLYSRRSFKARAHDEMTLIESELKFQPIKKYHVNLDNMTPANKKKALAAGKKWCLKLTSMYRDATHADIEANKAIESPKVVVIITIKDTRKKGVAYDECIQMLNEHNFTHNDIIVQQHINVDNEDI